MFFQQWIMSWKSKILFIKARNERTDTQMSAISIKTQVQHQMLFTEICRNSRPLVCYTRTASLNFLWFSNNEPVYSDLHSLLLYVISPFPYNGDALHVTYNACGLAFHVLFSCQHSLFLLGRAKVIYFHMMCVFFFFSELVLRGSQAHRQIHHSLLAEYSYQTRKLKCSANMVYQFPQSLT